MVGDVAGVVGGGVDDEPSLVLTADGQRDDVALEGGSVDEASDDTGRWS